MGSAQRQNAWVRGHDRVESIFNVYAWDWQAGWGLKHAYNWASVVSCENGVNEHYVIGGNTGFWCCYCLGA